MMASLPDDDDRDDAPLDSLALRCARLGEGEVDGAAAAARARQALTRGGDVESACRRAVTALLVERAQAEPADPRPRRQLGRVWLPQVLRWCRWLCGHRLDPQDLAHDVLVTLMTDAHRIRDPDAAEGWLRRITHRRVRAATRRAWFRLRAPDEPAEQVEPAPDASLALDRHRRLARVRAVLDELPLADRELLVLHYMEGLSRAEIGRQLGMAEGTLNRRMTRARRRFEDAARRRGLAPDDTQEGPP